MTTPSEEQNASQEPNTEQQGDTDPQSLTGRARAKAHQRLDEAADRSEGFEQSVRRNASEARENWNKARANWKDTRKRMEDPIDQSYDKVKAYAERHPGQSVGIAFAAGFLVSRLFRR